MYAGHSAHFCRTFKKIAGQTNNNYSNIHWENVMKIVHVFASSCV